MVPRYHCVTTLDMSNTGAQIRAGPGSVVPSGVFDAHWFHVSISGKLVGPVWVSIRQHWLRGPCIEMASVRTVLREAGVA